MSWDPIGVLCRQQMVGEEWCSWDALRVSEVFYPQRSEAIIWQASFILYFLLSLFFFLILLPVHQTTPLDSNFHSPFPPHSFAMSGCASLWPWTGCHHLWLPQYLAHAVSQAPFTLSWPCFSITNADLLVSHTKIMKVFFFFQIQKLKLITPKEPDWG